MLLLDPVVDSEHLTTYWQLLVHELYGRTLDFRCGYIYIYQTTIKVAVKNPKA